MLSLDSINLLYVLASILFILGLKKLSRPDSARKGNLISAIGMLVAIVAALLTMEILNPQWILVGLGIGTVVGVFAAFRVKMTSMPELVALFNGFGGIASLLVGWAEFIGIHESAEKLSLVPLIALVCAVLIGAVTFTGSLVAWCKLAGIVGGKPFLFPGQKIVNSLLLVGMIGAGCLIVLAAISSSVFYLSSSEALYLLIGLSLIFGVMVVVSIGGADMPVVISLLNSYSGIAACAAGFIISNNVLIVSGALVGASGIILTSIMCKAMNRSLSNVLFSGFGSGAKSSKSKEVTGEIKSISSEDAFLILEAAQNVIFVPGYGMAVAQAQHAVKELSDLLEKNGAEVNFAIHPVAGRMPGHMNVLLAEANVPYEQLREMDDINPVIENADVAVVIGANDVVNPAAIEDEGSPIYGMPVINVNKARTCFVLKRSMNAGFAGIDNPLFFKDNTRMLFGDAKETISSLVSEFKS
jgi:NAD(P) transhydrogenase subunit beta